MTLLRLFRRCRFTFALLSLFGLGRAQTIFVSNSDRIIAYNSANGAYLPGGTTANGLQGVLQTAIDANGRIYASQTLNHNVGIYDAANGATITTGLIAAGFHSPAAIGVDAATNRLYVGSTQFSTIGVFNATTGAVINSSLVPFAASPQDMLVDAGRLLVTNNGNRVSVFDATTGATLSANFITGLTNPIGLALGAGNRLYVVSLSSGIVGVYDATTGATINASFITGLNSPRDLALDSTGHLYVSAYNGSYSIVNRYDALTGALLAAEVAISGFTITSLAFAPIPEPAGSVLGCGALAFGFTMWRRRRRAA
jgi:DNA-binding beta-propeller fold protein YncE